ncbi:hypothetical protein GBA52_022328 [Prunus armeniaca]|nr:hypothetical protein GBA52_022328 [Prunus armeniaca]
MLSTLVHAPTVCSPSGSSLNPLSKHIATRASMATASARSSARIAIVGDVHDQWNLEEDTKALELLQLVCFCSGDFGEESVELVQSVAELRFAKAVILGNHDAWHTKQFSGKKKDGVQLQLECLGEEHVAYRRLDFPVVKLSVVGGRPFSCGGQQLFRPKLLLARYGVQDMDGSAKRICKAALGAPEDHLVILLAHNGPTGLGSNLDDVCGKDWVYGGGDHGDPDGNGLRKMIVVGADNTIYLNGAIVPRVKKLNDEFVDKEPDLSTPESCGTIRAFTIVEIVDGAVDKIVESWVSVVGDRITLEEEHMLFNSAH